MQVILKDNDLTLRPSEERDAETLAAWWNDGRIMAHAGWPQGVNTTKEKVAERISHRRSIGNNFIIELNGKPIGEMGYHTEDVGAGTPIKSGEAGIGIKICDFSLLELGLGTRALRLLIDYLFNTLKFKKIHVDANFENPRAQHVYEKLGFKKIRILETERWTDQMPVPARFIIYEMLPTDFVAE